MKSKSICSALVATGIIAGLTSLGGCPAEHTPTVGTNCTSDIDCSGPYICEEVPEDFRRICIFGIRGTTSAAPEPEPGNPEPNPDQPEPSPGPPVPGVVVEPEPVPAPEPEICPNGFAFDGTSACSRMTILDGIQSGRSGHTATLDDQNRVLIAGGFGDDSLAPQTYLITPDSIELGPLMDIGTVAARAIKLSSGEILLAGGIHNQLGPWESGVWTINTETNNVALVFPLAEARYGHVLYRNVLGTLVVVGGGAADGTSSTTLEEVGINGMLIETNVPVVGFNAQVLDLGDGTQVVMGGQHIDGEIGENIIVFGNDLNTFDGPPNNTARYGLTYLQARNLLIAAGGRTADGNVSSEIWISSPGSGSWDFVGNLNTPRFRFPLVQDATGRILAVGGESQGGPLATIESVTEVEPGLFNTEVVATLSQARSGLTATKFEDGTLVFSGGILTGNGSSPAVEIFEAILATP